ncbi:type II toxin-antitoxin system RelE/ParE family toxin [Kosakonia pseudosacchari]|uniref:type II toxin-antitoxin system RelE/ParE family toxin n=1 Tax=Kosakonia pseudosacchari TaxID=1646340 RepID=UPI0022EFED3C|nr:type II toxin-antitoxin system RelE/ParE family toxin [Kosakonia pseudosacchari]WBU49100.1 type II toxin-antitoxin system RelE/ParE family toxin [Kosakonia pseudosacchari]
MLPSRPTLKPIIWIGSSYDDLRAFPECVRKDAGYQLHKIQAGLEATDWKPMMEIGAGVAEIRLRDHAGAFRIFYLARFEDALYVLHCFHKKSQRTPFKDKTIARTRYRALVEHHRSQK